MRITLRGGSVVEMLPEGSRVTLPCGAARTGDPKAEGKRICIELLQELTQIPAVSGAHIMAPRNHSAIAEVIAEARSAGISSRSSAARSPSRSPPAPRNSAAAQSAYRSRGELPGD